MDIYVNKGNTSKDVKLTSLTKKHEERNFYHHLIQYVDDGTYMHTSRESHVNSYGEVGKCT